MPDTPSIVLVKRFTYRGQNEEFSNKYHFSGTTPVDTAAWKALADAMITAEKPTVDSRVSWVRAYGYVAGNDNSVAQIDYTLPPNTVVSGTAALTAGYETPGDVAATVRWYTGALNSRGKKIYCRKYLHGVMRHATVPDQLNAVNSVALATWAAKLIDGTLPGTFRYCGPQGAVLSAPAVDPWLTTRTLKRRGKRPRP